MIKLANQKLTEGLDGSYIGYDLHHNGKLVSLKVITDEGDTLVLEDPRGGRIRIPRSEAQL